ncbi:MAG: ribonuclease III [Oligoflexales bacterium]|nr:ribonuclease III [Oligoflexales bacterium]
MDAKRPQHFSLEPCLDKAAEMAKLAGSEPASYYWKTYFPKEYGELPKLCQRLGYSFQNESLLLEALTHRSAVISIQEREKSNVSWTWNERLEFLGDSVLGLVVSTLLWEQEQNWSEGQLSRIRSSLVCEGHLAKLGLALGLPQYLIVGRGEMISGSRYKESILADAVEALIGAIYRDRGFVEAQRILRSLLDEQFSREQLSLLLEEDHKSQLQVLSQGQFRVTPTYVTLRENGPDHSKEFEVAAVLDGKILAHGRGSSKKKASQDAAKQALSSLVSTSVKGGDDPTQTADLSFSKEGVPPSLRIFPPLGM